jgi:WD40 repeat protein
MCIKVGIPIQCCAWNSDTNTSISLGCINGFVKCVDLTSGAIVDIGKHNDPVNKVFYSPSQNVIMSIAYDQNIHFWQRGNQNPVFTYPTKDKIYAADFVNPLLILATSQ